MPGRKYEIWDGVTDRSSYSADSLAKRDRLADAARAGDWSTVFDCLEEPNTGLLSSNWTNVPRIGGSSGYTPLHQAAWHGADVGTVARLVGMGAWRTLRENAGERAIDIAERRGHAHMISVLRPAIRHPVPADVLEGLQRGLHAVIEERAGELVRARAGRLPQLEPLTELDEPAFFFPVPGMYGGFNYRLEGRELIVNSFCRISGGSGQTHRVTAGGIQLVDTGWG